MENPDQFELRKKDHLRLALNRDVQAENLAQFDRVSFQHEALPEIDFQELEIATQVFSSLVSAPIFISSMTAGHQDAAVLNTYLAKTASDFGWLMGVGSQRRELSDIGASGEWKKLRAEVPGALLFGNIGLAQVITSPLAAIQKLVDQLGAEGLFVHTNPLQESLQIEGTPQFRGGINALEKLCASLTVPVVLKEVGCGFSVSTLQRLNSLGLSAVDVSGAGGTHWGRIEVGRREPIEGGTPFGQVFSDWGISTVESLQNAREANPSYKIWASGGVRSGLDVAKCVALGAEMVGLAHPCLQRAIGDIERGTETLPLFFSQLEEELKTAMFCTGSKTLADLRRKGVLVWK